MTRPQDEGNGTTDEQELEEGADSTPIVQATTSAGTMEAEQEEWDQEKAKGLITTLRDREKTLAKQVKDKDRELKALQDASKTEQERKDAELEDLRALKTKYESEQREQTTRTVFMKEAQRQGATRPDALFKLAEGLELEDDGTPANAESVLRELKKDYPEMFGGGSADGGAGRGQSPRTPNMNDQIRQALRK